MLKYEKNSVLHVITFDIEKANRKINDVFSDRDNISVYSNYLRTTYELTSMLPLTLLNKSLVSR